MPYFLGQPIREKYTDYSFFDKHFNDEECQKIIDLHKTIPKAEATVGGGTNGVVDKNKRVSDVHWVEWNSDREWLFSKLATAVQGANNTWWNFHLSGLGEPLQLTHYKGSEEEKGFYNWHEDHGFTPGFSHRKLSGIVTLNDGFTGGEFEFFERGALKENTKGTLILFPSFKAHRVVPVTNGERWSLVFWVSGPPWC